MRLLAHLACASALIAPLTSQLISSSLDNSVGAVQNHSRALALMPDGRYWSVTRNGPDLELRHAQACDQTTWTYADSTPTGNDGSRASIVIDPDCCTLHVLWDANVLGVQQVFYGQYKTTACPVVGWDGPPCLISPPGISCYADDIEVTARGTVVAAYTETGWSVWLRQRSAACTWLPAQQLSTDSLGFRANMQAVGETIHSSFRTSTGSYGIRYRAYDTCTTSYLTTSDIQVHAGTSNTSHIAADGCGNLYIMYSTRVAGNGQICVEYAPAGNANSNIVWIPTATWCVQDTPLLIGNVNYSNYTLAAGAGGDIHAVYSLADELFTRWHYQSFNQGVLTGSASQPGFSPIDSFYCWAGLRSTQSTSNVVVVSENRNPTSANQREVWFGDLEFPTGRRTTKYGVSCACSTECDVPDLDCLSLPTACPTSVGLTLKRAPALAPVALLVGATKTNIDLAILGAPGCSWLTDPFAVVSMTTDGNGIAQLVIAASCVPDCSKIYFQYAILELGCNTLGVKMSNGLVAVFE